LAWLMNNTIRTCEPGKEFNFGFLWQRAGYDINQR
jgi:general L-amino acid transport system permease protein